jgi:Tol biopolymer transport system component
VYRSTILGTVTSDPTAAAATLALSPVGDRLAFIGDAAGTNLVYVRALDDLGLSPLAGTEGARALFWSPDGRSLAFIAGNKLKTIDATGSRPALEIADAFVPLPGSWNRDGVILFTPTAGSPLSRVSAVGGPVTPVTTLDEKTEEFVHSNPSFLPDGRHFTYVAHASGRILRGVYIGSLESSERVKLLDDASDAQYGGNMLLYRRARTLMAQRFDAGRMRLTGPAVPVADGLEISEAAIFPRTGAFSISETGVLVYRAETSAGSQLQWLDRSGRVVGTLGDRAKYLDVMLSPGGTLASVSIMEPSTATRDLWVYDIGTGRRNRFTFDPEDDLDQRWSPDGQRIAFASRRKGHLDLYVKLASGAGSEDLLLADDLDKYPQSWSPDGRYLLYAAIGATTEQDLWVLPLTGVHPKPYPFVQTPYSEGTGQFSPDGRWIVYRSNEAAGRFQLYVTPFPSRAGKWQITTTGGTAPRWRSDGKEIFYEASGNVLTAMSISTSGGRVEVGSPRTLFHVRPAGPRSFYDASRDGQRFLVNTADEPAVSTSLTFVTNWPALLKQ